MKTINFKGETLVTKNYVGISVDTYNELKHIVSPFVVIQMQ